jgi:PAS domain S-box-containing protein
MIVSTRKSTLQLLLIMILIPLMVTGLSIMIVYKVVYNEKKEYLQELSEIQTSFIRSIFKESKDPKIVIRLLQNQQKFNRVLGNSGELIVGFLKNDSIFFLLDHLKLGIVNPKPIALNSNIAIPLQYSLKKNTGFIKGLDYSGHLVLAYCDYLPELEWGIVTKIDVAEVNKPFYLAGVYSLIAAILLVLIGVLIFRKISSPILNNIIQSENRYRNLFEYSAVPIWEEDFSKVKQYFNRLSDSGVKEFRTYFETHPAEIKRMASLIKVTDVNQKSILFFNVDRKEDLITNLLFYFDDDSLNVFREEIIALANGATHFESEIQIRTLTGGRRYLVMHLSVLPGFKNSLSKVLVSFIDITERNLMEQALRESEEKFKIIATNTLDHILIQDSKLRYISVINPQLGLTEEEMIGKTDKDFLTRSEAEYLTKIKKSVLETGKTEFLVTPLTDKEGNIEYFEGYYIPKFNHNNEIDGIIGYFRNITEQKRIEDALLKHEATLRGILDATKESIWLFNNEGEIVLGNKTAIERFGNFADEVIGKRLNELLPEELARSQMTHLRETFKSGKPLEFEDDLDNIKFFHSFYPVYDEKGHVNYVAAYDRDITEKKHAEEQLKKNADSLRELNATKDKFFGIIAHDLRNPFSSLLGASEILSNNVRQYDIDSIETFSRLSYDAAKSCYALLENLLEWSRAQTGNLKFNPRKVNITEIIEENLSVLKTFAANKKITLYSKVSEDIFSLADRDMLKAILRNLLNNALKFTCLNGEVFVNAIEEKNHIIISVKDNGIGIPKKDIDKLFRIDIKYTKVGTNEERGTGLGLLLCKEFVEQHGGKIWVESDEGEGSEFKFTIPLKKES